MSALVELLEDCRPSDLDRAIPIVQRLHAWLGEAAWDGCEKAGFAGRALPLAQTPRFDAEARLTLAGDVLDICEMCALPLADADHETLGRLARAALGEVAGFVRHRGEAADVRVMRRHTLFPGPLHDADAPSTRSFVEYLAALAGESANETVDVWVRGELSPQLGGYIAERLGPALDRVRVFAIDRQPDYLAHLIQQGPRTSHFWRESPLAVDVSLFALTGPTLMLAPQDAPPLQHADVYWSARDAGHVEALWRRCGAPEPFVANYLEAPAIPHRPASARAHGRRELGLGDDDLVIATAGTRLGGDFDQAFVDGLGPFLLADPRRRWLVAGPLPDFWVAAFRQVLGGQFVHLPHGGDCEPTADLFANPFRAGGSAEALAAIQAGAVLLTRGDIGEAAAFVPPGHRAGGAEDYFDRLEQLATDPALRETWAAEQRAHAGRRTDPALFASGLEEMIELAYKRYRARLPASLEEILALRPPGLASLRGRA